MNRPDNDAAPATETASVLEKPEVIAYRKSCDPTGTGLSHYVLLDAGDDDATPRPASR